MTTIPQNIRRAIERTDMTQSELAERSGVTPSCICMILKGKKTPSVKTIKLIANALGCHPSEIIDDRTERRRCNGNASKRS